MSCLPDRLPTLAFEFKIIGGTDANVISMPYQASIRELRKATRNVCGGSILAPTWIVTAAHCFRKDNERRDVVVGMTRQSQGGIVHQIKRVIKHPNFAVGPNRNSYDIALLELITPITFNRKAQPVPLPQDDQPPPVGTYCSAAGWGRTAYDRPGVPARRAECLQYAELPLRSRKVCLKYYTDPAYEDYFVGKYKCMICAGNKTSPSIYKGDSGTGLVCNGILYGIASFGMGDSRNSPKVFSDVYTLRPFIREHVK